MGLNETDRDPIYLGCFQGKLTRKLPKPTEKTITRVNKNGETIHELHFDSISGLIVGLGIKDGDYGKQLAIKLYDDEEDQEFVVNVSISSGYSYGIFKRIGNIDFSIPVRLKAYMVSDPSGDKAGFTVFQNDDKVPLNFSKENPQGMPDWKKVTFKGKETWDDTETLNFFIDLIKKDVLPVIKKNAEMSKFGLVSENLDAEFKATPGLDLDEAAPEEVAPDTSASRKKELDKKKNKGFDEHNSGVDDLPFN